MAQNITAVVPGRFTHVEFKKEYPERKGAIITKITRGVFRFGLKVANLTHYQYKGNGLNGEDKWLAYPYLIQGVKGKKVRLFSTYNEIQKAKSEYFVTLNGETRKTTKEEILENDWLTPSTVNPKRGEFHMCDIFLDNIIKIGK